MASHPEGDPWVRIEVVLAEASNNVEPPWAYDGEARALASKMRGVRSDWGKKPCVTWTVAEALLESLQAEAAGRRAAIEERLIEADQRFRAQLPPGIPHGATPEGVPVGIALMLSDPMPGTRRQSVLEHSLEHPAGAIVYTPIGGEQ